MDGETCPPSRGTPDSQRPSSPQKKPKGRGPESQPDKAWSARVWCEDLPYPGSTLPHKPTPPLAWVFHAPQRQCLPWKGKDKHKRWFLSPRGMVAKNRLHHKQACESKSSTGGQRGDPPLGATPQKAIGAVCPHQQRSVGTDEVGSAGSETAIG